MQLGMIGLGRMGANLVRRLMRDGHECVVYDVSKPTRSTSWRARARPARTRSTSSWRSSTPPRAVWIMVPAAFVDDTDREAARAPGSRATSSSTAATPTTATTSTGPSALQPTGIHYVDVGTSGGVFGLDRGFCLMIGGEDDVVAHLDPIFATIAPGVDAAPRTPGPHRRPVDRGERLPALRAQRRRPLREDGPQRHRVRDHGRVRRGPQHPAQRQRRASSSARADAETAPLRDPKYYQYDLDIPAVAEVWRRGQRRRVVAARPHRRTRSSQIPDLADFAGRVSDSRRGSLDGPCGDRRGRARADVLERRAVRPLRRRAATPTSPTSCCRRCARSSAATTRSSIRRSERPSEQRPIRPTRWCSSG